MDRAKDHICFVIWFVGISYMALWPLALPCAGLATESWQNICQSQEALMLSPGLHLIGGAAACCVTLRLLLLLLRRLLRLLPQPVWHATRWQKVAAWLKPGCDVPPSPRWVPRRRDFGLRRPAR